MKLLPYDHEDAASRPSDPAAAAMAKALADWLIAGIPGVGVEHIGSTAVPDLPGKGVIDLMLTYDGADPAELARVRSAVDSLGFQHQTGREPWPESRPMRIAAVERQGRRFRVHLHVIDARSPEVGTLLRFRDRLRAEPDLRLRYAELKAAILAAGTTDSLDYSKAKGAFIELHSR